MKDEYSVLIVDDESYVIELMALYLNNEYKVHVATNGEDAIKIALSEYPDIIVMDIKMPGMNGLEAGRTLKENPVTKDVPIIFCSVYHDREHLLEVLRLGGVEYISKPIIGAEFKNKVDQQRRIVKLEREAERRESLLLEQSKLACMSDLLTHIAINFKQPLHLFSINNLNLQKKLKGKECDEHFLQDHISESQKLIKNMDETIDDYTSYFFHQEERVVFPILSSVVRSFAAVDMVFKKSDVEIRTNIDKEIYLYGYTNEFSQVLISLFKNSVEAIINRSVQGGFVEVKAQQNEKAIHIIVQDNGGGIDQKYLDKVFQPDFTTKHHSNGSGTGLFISKMIIEKSMQGSLELKNNLDGLCVTITLPKNRN